MLAREQHVAYFAKYLKFYTKEFLPSPSLVAPAVETSRSRGPSGSILHSVRTVYWQVKGRSPRSVLTSTYARKFENMTLMTDDIEWYPLPEVEEDHDDGPGRSLKSTDLVEHSNSFPQCKWCPVIAQYQLLLVTLQQPQPLCRRVT